jgi:hypothetical protein
MFVAGLNPQAYVECVPDFPIKVFPREVYAFSVAAIPDDAQSGGQLALSLAADEYLGGVLESIPSVGADSDLAFFTFMGTLRMSTRVSHLSDLMFIP